MKIVVTGSLGNISKPLTSRLVEAGYTVTVISSKPERKPAIEALGAQALIGSLEDTDFLSSAFKGADLVYCMEPAPNFQDQQLDPIEHYVQIGKNFHEAIAHSGVKQVVHLSSIGAHTDKGNGLLAFHHHIEQELRKLPETISITFMRPVGFYYNLLSFIPVIKAIGSMASNYGAEDRIPWVSPKDIALAVFETIRDFQAGRHVRYVASEEISCQEIATILGKSIGIPDLKWHLIPGEIVLKNMLDAGVNEKLARLLVDMNEAIHNGTLYEDYYKHRPEPGPTKIADFASVFAAAYQAGKTGAH